MPDGNRSTELIASDIWNKASQISIVTKTRTLKFCFCKYFKFGVLLILLPYKLFLQI